MQSTIVVIDLRISVHGRVGVSIPTSLRVTVTAETIPPTAYFLAIESV